ncbi:MAG: leucine-rich repeat domain-containing protein [Clostridia bacterium]|nr:leucine-rich repeat domain-containing protein [Clostridia bacterium]
MKKITTILVIALLIVALFTMVACDTTQESNNNIDLDQTMSESIEQADIAEKKGVVSNSNSADVTESTSVRTDGKFVFELNNDGDSYTLFDVNESFADVDVVIPETFNGKPVTIIDEYAFQECNTIQSVTIPDSIIGIGEGAFASCENLSFVKFGNNAQFKKIGDYVFASCEILLNVTIPSSVTTIGEGAFYNCESLSNIYYLGTESEWSAMVVEADNDYINQARVHHHSEVETCDLDFEFTLNDNGESYTLDFIDESFMGTKVVVPATHNGKPVIVIGDYALFGDRFETIILPEGITMIESNAFAGANSLHTIVIPSSVNIIDTDAFKGCDSLRNVYYLGTYEEYWNDTFFTNNSALTSVVPHFHDIDEIDACCMYELELNRDMRSYTIVGVTDSFDGGDIVLPETFNGMPITKLADEAFFDCETITSIVIPDSYTTIGREVLSYCLSLKSVYIGKNVTYIGEYSFTSPVESIEVHPENLTYKSIDGNLYTKDGAVLLRYAFGSPALTFRVPDGVTTIGDEACIFSMNMVRVIIPESVTTLGYGAFGESYNLACVVFEGDCKITEIPDYCFAWTDLREITIPSSVTKIGEGAFEDCIELYEVNFADNSNVTTIGERAFANCSKLRYVDFGDNSQLVTIGDAAFDECWGLYSVEFGANSKLESISGAFNYTGIQQIFIPASVTDISDAFVGCSKLCGVFFEEGSQLTNMSGAFKDCKNLPGISIPEGVTNISGAFVDCTNLKEINIPESVTDMSAAFHGCTSLVEANIPENIKDLGMWTFRDCESLEYIVIPDSVETIGYWAFGNCKSLTTVYVHEGSNIKTLQNGVFDGCTSLRNIELASTLEYIGEYVFRDCDSLTDIWYDGTEEDWNAIEKYGYEQFEGKTIQYMR